MSNDPKKLGLSPDLYSRNTIISRIAKRLIGKPDIKIVDIGGYGGKLNLFFSKDANFTVMDIKDVPAEEEGVTYKQGDARKIPFSDRNFDMVISTDLLEHMDAPDRQKAIKEMLRITKRYVILGVPNNTKLVEHAEENIRAQYEAAGGEDHPFLSEHASFGLPDPTNIESVLEDEGAQYFKIAEGNLTNWYIHQLYTSTRLNEQMNEKKLKFNEFFNGSLKELGNLRAPTYRTIYVISKEGNNLPEAEIKEDLEKTFAFKPETFMELLKYAFTDMREFINQRKDLVIYKERKHDEELQDASEKTREMKNRLEEQKETIEKARRSVALHREAIQELRNYLAENERTIELLKENKESMEEEIAEHLKKIKEQQEELSGMDKRIDLLLGQIRENEQSIRRRDAEITQKEAQIRELKTELDAYRGSLHEILNSRSYKIVKAYSAIKKYVWTIPAANIKKGYEILVKLGPKEFLTRGLRKIKKQPVNTSKSAYAAYIEKNKIIGAGIARIKKQIKGFKTKPLISIVLPVYNVEPKFLKECIESVKTQFYANWELCIADDNSSDKKVKALLEEFNDDKRIKIKFRKKNGGIVKASNDALTLATGAYIGFLDNDDTLAPDALFELVKALQEDKYDFIYSDEDKISEAGERCEPFFKPEWSPDLMLSINYTCHFSVYRVKLVRDAGGLREGFDGSQDYDLALRISEKAKKIKHIPRILYHWRKVEGSTSGQYNAKPYCFDSAKKALRDALQRRGIEGVVQDGIWQGSYRVKRALKSKPKVSIIIPFKDKPEILRECVNSILQKTAYENYEILLVDNQSELFETKEYLGSLKGESKVRTLKYEFPFNFSAINNFAAKQAEGEMLLLLNNDISVITEDWIECMLEHAQRADVGAVGAKLLYPNGTVQHAGTIIGVGGLANHAFLKQLKDDHGYFGLADVIRNVSAVTGACLMIRKDVYINMDGLNEKNLGVSFNDVDLCLRLREKGYLIVYTPYAQLTHHESLSRGYTVAMNEVRFIQRNHRSILQKGDPYYNPNLTRERFDFSLRVEDKV
jgi:glycosyltransferase involved in cell wall biosynthesis